MNYIGVERHDDYLGEVSIPLGGEAPTTMEMSTCKLMVLRTQHMPLSYTNSGAINC